MFHEALVGEQDFLNAKTTFAVVPSLIVLCDLSAYFTDSAQATYVCTRLRRIRRVTDVRISVSSYLMLISRALETISVLSSRSGRATSLAVLDSGLSSLRLPLVRAITPDQDDGPSTSSSVRKESLAFLAQGYFEWVGTVEEGKPSVLQCGGSYVTLTIV